MLLLSIDSSGGGGLSKLLGIIIQPKKLKTSGISAFFLFELMRVLNIRLRGGCGKFEPIQT